MFKGSLQVINTHTVVYFNNHIAKNFPHRTERLNGVHVRVIECCWFVVIRNSTVLEMKQLHGPGCACVFVCVTTQKIPCKCVCSSKRKFHSWNNNNRHSWQNHCRCYQDSYQVRMFVWILYNQSMNCVYLYVDSADVDSINSHDARNPIACIVINNFQRWMNANNCSSNIKYTPQKVIFIIFYACVYLFMLSQLTTTTITITFVAALPHYTTRRKKRTKSSAHIFVSYHYDFKSIFFPAYISFEMAIKLGTEMNVEKIDILA